MGRTTCFTKYTLSVELDDISIKKEGTKIVTIKDQGTYGSTLRASHKIELDGVDNCVI